MIIILKGKAAKKNNQKLYNYKLVLFLVILHESGKKVVIHSYAMILILDKKSCEIYITSQWFYNIIQNVNYV